MPWACSDSALTLTPVPEIQKYLECLSLGCLPELSLVKVLQEGNTGPEV